MCTHGVERLQDRRRPFEAISDRAVLGADSAGRSHNLENIGGKRDFDRSVCCYLASFVSFL